MYFDTMVADSVAIAVLHDQDLDSQGVKMQDESFFVFKKEGFQLPAPSQWW